MIATVRLVHGKESCIRANAAQITWTREMLDRFISAYKAKKDDYSFVFDGNVFVTAYAKYLIEYLKPLL